MSLPTIWQNDAFISFLKDAGYQRLQWNDGLKEYLVFILSASPYLTLNDLLKLYYDTYGTWEIQFTPGDLFILGQYGFWWDASSTTYITQDSLGTTPVTGAGDPVGLLIDRSGNGIDGIQPTTSLKPLYQETPNRIVFDKADDVIYTNLLDPITESIFLIYTDIGVIVTRRTFSGATFYLFPATVYLPKDNIIAVICSDGTYTATTMQLAKSAYGSSTFTPIGSIGSWFRGFTGITYIDATNWNLSQVTSMSSTFNGCINLHTFYYSQLDTSSCTSFFSSFAGCTSLTNLDLSGFDFTSATSISGICVNCTALTTVTIGDAFTNTACVNYFNAFSNCALTQDSVDAILRSVNNANTSGGSLTINGGTNATPSVTGQAAATALRSRGWTVTLNGF